MMSTTTIAFASEFSEFPAGRYRNDGPFPGEAFRDDLLEPRLREFDLVAVDLDGAMGYGSSFLEEAFGGLVRLGKFSAETLHQKLKLKCVEDPSVIDEIWQYIDGAHA